MDRGSVKLDTFIMIRGLTVSHVVKSALCVAVTLTVGCTTVNERALKSSLTSEEGRKTAYLDLEEPIDAEWTHSPRRADLVIITAFWQMEDRKSVV